MEITQNADHIMVVDGVFDQALIDQILDRFHSDTRRSVSWSTKNNAQQYREGECLKISKYPEWKDLDDQMFDRISAALDLYAKRYNIATQLKDNGYTISEQEPGQKTNQHIDSIHGASAFRLITVILYLNQPGEGGNTVFPEQGQFVRPQPGRMVMFPPFYTHPHYSEAAAGSRYILVSWAHSDPAMFTHGDPI